MKKKRFCFIIMLMIASLLALGCQQRENTAAPGNGNPPPASWPYPFVVINGLLYVIEDEKDKWQIIPKEQLGKKLGEVKRKYGFEGDEKPGDDAVSTYLPVGAELYEIANEDWKQYIAVEVENDVFVKAIEESLYLKKL